MVATISLSIWLEFFNHKG